MKKWPLAILCMAAVLGYCLLQLPRKTSVHPLDGTSAGQTGSVAAIRDVVGNPVPNVSNRAALPGQVRATATASATVLLTPAHSTSAATPAELAPSLPPDVALENMRTTLRQYGLMF